MSLSAFVGVAAASALQAAIVQGAAWNYNVSDTTNGPLNWGGFCANGTRQSPINIPYSGGNIPVNANLSALPAVWTKVTASAVSNDGHSIKVTPSAPTSVIGRPNPVSPATNYTMLQFHFHYPSEHTFNGAYRAAEVHFVHQNPADSSLAVVGISFDIGAASPLLSQLRWDNLPALQQGDRVVTAALDLSNLINWSSTNYVTYEGSLTTPPCSEGVRWVVVTDVQTMSQEQLDKLKTAFGEGSKTTGIIGTARPVQALNGRTVSWSPGTRVTPSPTQATGPSSTSDGNGMYQDGDITSWKGTGTNQDGGSFNPSSASGLHGFLMMSGSLILSQFFL